MSWLLENLETLIFCAFLVVAPVSVCYIGNLVYEAAQAYRPRELKKEHLEARRDLIEDLIIAGTITSIGYVGAGVIMRGDIPLCVRDSSGAQAQAGGLGKFFTDVDGVALVREDFQLVVRGPWGTHVRYCAAGHLVAERRAKPLPQALLHALAGYLDKPHDIIELLDEPCFHRRLKTWRVQPIVVRREDTYPRGLTISRSDAVNTNAKPPVA